MTKDTILLTTCFSLFILSTLDYIGLNSFGVDAFIIILNAMILVCLNKENCNGKGRYRSIREKDIK